jgi:hypothetical protein
MNNKIAGGFDESLGLLFCQSAWAMPLSFLALLLCRVSEATSKSAQLICPMGRSAVAHENLSIPSRKSILLCP